MTTKRKTKTWKKGKDFCVCLKRTKRFDSARRPNDPLHTDWLSPSSPLLRACQLSPPPGLSARSEVEPDTGARGATGHGHFGLAVRRTDVCSGAVIIAAATEEQRRGAPGWMPVISRAPPGRGMTCARHSRRSRGRN